jgi:hypothetical protein
MTTIWHEILKIVADLCCSLKFRGKIKSCYFKHQKIFILMEQDDRKKPDLGRTELHILSWRRI